MIDKVSIVVGADFGNEGRGHFTNHIVTKLLSDGYKSLMIRPSGDVSSHEVIDDDFSHIFSYSGPSSKPEVPTLSMKHCLFYPLTFFAEQDILEETNSLFKNTEIAIHGNCQIITQLDVILSQLRNIVYPNPFVYGLKETIERCKTKRRTTLFKQFENDNEFLSSDLYNIDLCKKVIADHQLRNVKNDLVEQILKSFDLACESNRFIESFSEMRKRCLCIKGKKDVEKFINDREINSLIFICPYGLAESDKYGLEGLMPSLLWILNSIGQTDVSIDVFYVTKSYSSIYESGPFGDPKYRNVPNDFSVCCLHGNELSERIKNDQLNLQIYQNKIGTNVCKNYKSSLVITCLDLTNNLVITDIDGWVEPDVFVDMFNLPKISYISNGQDAKNITEIRRI